MKTLLVLDEVVAMLRVVGASDALVERFRVQATTALQHKARGRVPDDTPEDHVTVNSGLGKAGAHVELTINDQLTQMDPKKAREIGLMLLEGAEAATSDAVFVLLLQRIGITDAERLGAILLDLRELRQGTRGTSWPS
jgi:hypothetical protein